MKKGLKFYIAAWLILVAMFNVIVFVTPNAATVGDTVYTKFGGAFWSSYALIMLAMVGQLICAVFALKEQNKSKLFLNLPMVTVSYSAMIVSIVFGTVCMAVPNLPNWLGVIVAVLLLGFSAIAVVKAAAAADLIAETDAKVKVKTAFVKLLTADAEGLVARAKSEAAKAACVKVCEALRYSDPMSCEALSDVEGQITLKFNEFSNAVTSDADNLSALADELIVLVGDRNKKCKLLK